MEAKVTRIDLVHILAFSSSSFLIFFPENIKAYNNGKNCALTCVVTDRLEAPEGWGRGRVI